MGCGPTVGGPEDFPPAPWYELLPANETASGPRLRVVAYARHADQTLVHVLHGTPAWTDAHAAHCAWLMANGGKHTRSLCEKSRAQALPWTGVPSLRRAVQSHQAAIERDFAAMVGELHRSKLLLADAAKSARPCVEVELLDERNDRSVQLPDPATLLRARPHRGAQSTHR